jgi:uncharacterized protein YbdZ (MbtH family)
MKLLIRFAASSCSSMRPIADAGTNAAAVSSSLWPAANSAPWSIPCKAALERACLKFGESKMTAPKSWRPAGLQYVSQKRGTPVI